MVANTIGSSVLKMTSQISPLARFEKVHLICKNSLALPNKPLRALTVINTIKSKQCSNLDKRVGLVNISTGNIICSNFPKNNFTSSYSLPYEMFNINVFGSFTIHLVLGQLNNALPITKYSSNIL